MSEGDKLQEKEIENRVIALLQRSSKLYGDIARISEGNCERFEQGNSKIEVVGWYWQGIDEHACKPQGPFDAEEGAIWEAQT